MADPTTIIAIAGGIVGVVGGGGGIVSLIQMWRRAREPKLDAWESYRQQIRSAEARADGPEVERLRRDHEGQLEAWRTHQELTRLAPKEMEVVGAGPFLAEEEVEQLRRLLAASRALSPVFLSAEDYFVRGNACYEAGEFEDAVAAYDRSLELQSDDPATLCNRGAALSCLGRHEEALADCNDALELSPDDPAVLNNRGHALDNVGRSEQALADYNRSLELLPDDPAILCNRGTALSRLGRHEEALVDLNRSLELRPDDAATLDCRGTVLAGLGRHEAALANCARSLELSQGGADLSKQGAAADDLGHHEEVLPNSTQSEDPGSDQPATYYKRACLFALRGKVDEAMADLRRAIVGDPSYREEARIEEDFDRLRSHPRFRALVEGDESPAEGTTG